jgi:hypothetical protein
MLATSQKKNCLRRDMDFSAWVATTQMLELRLSQTHCPLPLPLNILWKTWLFVICSPHWRQGRRRTASGGRWTSLFVCQPLTCWTWGCTWLLLPSPFLITYYEKYHRIVTCSPHWQQGRRRTTSGVRWTSLSVWGPLACWTWGYPWLTVPTPFLITYYERITVCHL